MKEEDSARFISKQNKGAGKDSLRHPRTVLYFYVYPIALFETNTCKDVSGYLIGKDSHPDTNDSPVENVTAYIRE